MRVNAEVRGWCERALSALEVLGIGAVAAVAAVGADELTMQPVHLRAADLAVLARGL